MEQRPLRVDLPDSRGRHYSVPDKPTHELKLVMVGETGVGKTSLGLRYTKDVFRPYLDSTIGAAYFSRTIDMDESRLRLNIWDTAGQERYHSIAPLYYRGANGAIVVYDITNKQSFQRAKGWVNELKKTRNPDLVMVLSGNKADLASNRKVEQEEGEAFAKKYEMQFLETSAKTALNINELFHALVKGQPNTYPEVDLSLELRKSGSRPRRCCSKT